uniref:Serine/threonine-protein phosphatase n=1 Tax=Coralloluteibacterium stylophorae TaxID=1776034 RepID=A0A8J7VRM2_9GAMM
MIEFGHQSHVGLRRNLNEDTYYGDLELGLWLVADGMGGHDFGAVASAMAREAIVRGVRAGTGLADAVRHADDEILRHSHSRAQALPMGTTVAAVRIADGAFETVWVGDSRVYLFADGRLCQLTQDHSYVQTLIERGTLSAEQARTHPQRNVVTQALGVTATDALRIEPIRGSFRPGMQLLLCSDGLTEDVDDATIARIVARTDHSAQECVDQLLAAALDAGGSDNITIILVRCR